MAKLDPPSRILMGPGPTNVHPRVLRALSAQTIGHRDPEYFKMTDEVQDLLCKTFQTKNDLTLALPATGMGAMEACLCNLIEPGDDVLIGVSGVFGKRMVEIAKRYGAKVRTLEIEWGKVFTPAQFKEALDKGSAKVVALVHGETSTGAKQIDLDKIADVVHEAGGLLLADTVSSLAGADFKADAWSVDAVYSGSQKCLAVPPGISFLTFSAQAAEAVEKRKTPVTSWYFDLSILKNCWNEERFYHHTGPVNMMYGLLEGLRMVHEEGLEVRIARHAKSAAALYAGLEAMGLKLHVEQPEARLPTLTTVKIPEGADDAAVRKALLEKHNLEIGPGLGEGAGKLWRIGLMGANASANNVLLCLSALGGVLNSQGVKVDAGSGVEAAAAALNA